jgi:hypothetical protein
MRTGCSAAWLARHVRDVEAPGSNPGIPTTAELESVVPPMDALIFLMPIADILLLILYTPEIREDQREYRSAYQSGDMKTYAEEQAELGA